MAGKMSSALEELRMPLGDFVGNDATRLHFTITQEILNRF